MKRIVEFLWCKHSIEYLFCCVCYLFIRTSKLVFQVSWQKGTQCRKWNLKGCKSCFITKDIISNQKRCAFSIRISNIQRCCIAKVSSISCGTLFNQQCLYIYLSVLRNIYINFTPLFLVACFLTLFISLNHKFQRFSSTHFNDIHHLTLFLRNPMIKEFHMSFLEVIISK